MLLHWRLVPCWEEDEAVEEQGLAAVWELPGACHVEAFLGSTDVLAEDSRGIHLEVAGSMAAVEHD
jgi:hypothetical protein